MLFNEMCIAVDSMMIQIFNQPFNQELSQGILSKKIFMHYIIQDALYLADYSRALALTAARLPDIKHTQQYLQFALGAVQAERELHMEYLNNQSILHVEKSPACFMYTHYLINTANTASVEEAVASLLPCFWIYHKVGKKIIESQTDLINPYQNWINLYASEEFYRSVELAIAIINELGIGASASTKNKMIAAFIRSTQLEWLFWDSAYRCESWAITPVTSSLSQSIAYA